MLDSLLHLAALILGAAGEIVGLASIGGLVMLAAHASRVNRSQTLSLS